MSTAVPAPTDQRVNLRLGPVLLLLFAGSGCAALIYEVVWFQPAAPGGRRARRSRSGSSWASFMGGMCLGSLLLPRLASPQRHPLRVYAVLELGIGIIGLALPTVLPWLSGASTPSTSATASWASPCAAASAPPAVPTMLMGATLPAIARWLDTSRAGIASLGRFYGANIFGAIAGTLLAGFYLLRVHDTMVASRVAAQLSTAP